MLWLVLVVVAYQLCTNKLWCVWLFICDRVLPWVMKWWSKCISMAIAKTASRNVAFKVAKMRESIMKDQDEFLIRKSECEEVGLETNNKAALEDVGQNADLCITNQEGNTQN